MASSRLRQELLCPVCLDIYNNPVLLRCGHNFCSSCIESVFDSQEDCWLYTCPECRKRFTLRPSPRRNLKLSNIVGHYREHQTEEEEVHCTYCVDFPVPAIKTCLQCEASLCVKHMKRHCRSQDHILIEPNAPQDDLKCPTHKHLLKYYCLDDAARICLSCHLVGEHQRHHVELLNDACEKKKQRWTHSLEKMISNRKEAEEKIQRMQERRKEVQEKLASATEKVTPLFRNLKKQRRAQGKQVLDEIKREEERVSLQISDFIKELEMKKETLSKTIVQLEELCSLTDPLLVLKATEPDAAQSDHAIEIPSSCQLDHVLISLLLQRSLKLDFAFIPKLLEKESLLHENLGSLLLEVRTNDNTIPLLPGHKIVSFSAENWMRNSESELFTAGQVLSSTGISSGEHFWEVEVSQEGFRCIGVAYPSIIRSGPQSFIGYNEKSWSFTWINDFVGVSHNNECRPLSKVCLKEKLGIYLDYEGGVLSFYQLSDPIRRLHSFTAPFIEPLHLSFNVLNGWVRVNKKAIWGKTLLFN
ncbi:E3 ubiquitin/ISG15 ligase TRIM25-like [Xenopus laevis]|uniref:Uncharacterized protein n=2 Tax=Xenopus laevis TaxID=8355 RepID=A0A974H4F2_XENLA|nr:E3 ubiquitin/ISG15 ligase TRIM25-like [Xenopus laevis]OCT64488.1 hypothetical protein XELAEV_18045587mg [Xenopus laevis]